MFGPKLFNLSTTRIYESVCYILERVSNSSTIHGTAQGVPQHSSFTKKKSKVLTFCFKKFTLFLVGVGVGKSRFHKSESPSPNFGLQSGLSPSPTKWPGPKSSASHSSEVFTFLGFSDGRIIAIAAIYTQFICS
jgi:hypothetical protein